MKLQEYCQKVIENFEVENESADSDFYKSLPAVPDPEKIIKQNISHSPEHLKERIQQEYLQLGPIEELIEDPSISEIVITQNSIFYESGLSLKEHSKAFLTEYSFSRVFQTILEEAQIKVDWATPCSDGVWREFRLHVITPPLSVDGPVLTLRRMSKSKWSLVDLKQMGLFDDSCYHTLISALSNQSSLLVVGPTSTGKTTLINALLMEVPVSERVIVLEDTDEIAIPHQNGVKLLTREATTLSLNHFGLNELLRESLRMRPDRIVVGEVRGQEAKDIALTLSTGHSGFLGTLHAKSAREALWRLEMLIQMGAPEWSKEVIRQLIYHSLDLIVVLHKKDGVRKVFEIQKLAGIEKHGLLLEPVDFPGD